MCIRDRSNTHAKAGQRNAEIKDHFVHDRIISCTSSLIRQLYHFATDFDRVLLQLVGTDIENSLFKYRVTYRACQFYKNISMLFLFPVKDGKIVQASMHNFSYRFTVSLQ